MARTFDGSNDVIRVGIGNNALTNVWSVAAIFRPNSTPGLANAIISLFTSGEAQRFTLIQDTANKIGVEVNATLRTSTTTLTVGDWVFVAVTKATGTVTPRCHFYKYASAAWTHENASGTIANIGLALDRIRFGIYGGVTFCNGDIECVGLWNGTELTDAQIEQLPFSLQTWPTLSPTGLWLFDQGDVGQAIYDRTGGGANEVSRTETTVATTSVPVFNRYGEVMLVRGQAAAAAAATNRWLALLGVGS